jgi:hypothetical protein
MQFDREASQTRDYCVARNPWLRSGQAATLRAARPDPSLRKERLFKDDNQTAPLPDLDMSGADRRMKVILGILTLAMMWVVISPVFAGVPQGKATAPSGDAVEYRNTKYGFAFSLPPGWKGYTIVADKWEASDAQNGVVERGPVVSIRHPGWTEEHPWQDIPIMIFTLAQWESAEHSNLYAGGSAIGFHELGRNRKYAFAVSSRYNEDEVPGREEVDGILQHEPLRPLWSK